jgi:hypothetical protein
MPDRSRFAVGRQVSYSPTLDDEPATADEIWSAQIIAADRAGFTILTRRPNGEPLIRQGVGPERLGTRFGAAAEQPNETYPYDETLHFNERRQVANVTTATPGSIDSTAASWWGTINVYKDMTIERSHIHQIVGGGTGSTDIEVYRRRGIAGPFTLLYTNSLAGGGGDFDFAGATIPTGDLAKVLRGDYLYMQLTARASAPAPLGLLVDIHFTR